MFPGMSEAEIRVAEFRFRQMQDEARTRRLLGHDAGHRAGREPKALRRLGAAAAGIVALLVGRRADDRAGQTSTALPEGTAS